MTTQMETVLWISGVGTGLLFLALVGLIGLMYLLTAQWLFRPASVAATPEATPPEATTADPADDRNEEEEERDRQRRAVALAVAIACAQAERAPTLLTARASDWRRLHHNRRLSQPRSRARTRMRR